MKLYVFAENIYLINHAVKGNNIKIFLHAERGTALKK